jgi:DNA transposition AAA+ family ATPase
MSKVTEFEKDKVGTQNSIIMNVDTKAQTAARLLLATTQARMVMLHGQGLGKTAVAKEYEAQNWRLMHMNQPTKFHMLALKEARMNGQRMILMSGTICEGITIPNVAFCS